MNASKFTLFYWGGKYIELVDTTVGNMFIRSDDTSECNCLSFNRFTFFVFGWEIFSDSQCEKNTVYCNPEKII